MSKERSILFTGAMVLAIHEDRKTQTRRKVKLQSTTSETPYLRPDGLYTYTVCGGHAVGEPFACPYGKPGDILNVKESAWIFCEKVPNGTTPKGKAKFHYQSLKSAPRFYVANMEKGWKPKVTPDHPKTANEWVWRIKIGRFLPKWAVRTKLEVVSVRVERIKDLEPLDAIAEGIQQVPGMGEYGWTHVPYPFRDDAPVQTFDSPEDAFFHLFYGINARAPRSEDPFVWVIEFRRLPFVPNP